MASPQQLLQSRPPEIGFLFEQVNPDKISDKNEIRGLPAFWPLLEAAKNALIYVKANRTIQSPIGITFHLSPAHNNISLETYAKHLVEMDGTGKTVSTKLIGLRSIGDTLKNPSFCLRDARQGHETDLYCRAYKAGNIHVVVVDPENFRVKTQFVYNHKTNSAMAKMMITKIRDEKGNWTG